MPATTTIPTPRQRAFWATLMEEALASAYALPGGQSDAAEGTLVGLNERFNEARTVAAASAAIDALIAFKRTLTTAAPATAGPTVPDGFYATVCLTGANDLDFWRVEHGTGRWTGRVFVRRVIGGRPAQNIRREEQTAALRSILAAGPLVAARLYGQHIGRCGRCNRHLTDQESRLHGIGPDCRALEGWGGTRRPRGSEVLVPSATATEQAAMAGEPVNGVTLCACGCKYWEAGHCADCGDTPARGAA